VATLSKASVYAAFATFVFPFVPSWSHRVPGVAPAHCGMNLHLAPANLVRRLFIRRVIAPTEDFSILKCCRTVLGSMYLGRMA
jgi:hypothetical protein